MPNLKRAARTFVAGEDGPTAVEYALMLALVLVAWLSAAIGSAIHSP